MLTFGLHAFAAEPPPVWEWTIRGIRIPQRGDIADGYVDLRTPAGREVTLTVGEISLEGALVEKLEWVGSPVRARVTLRKGNEHGAVSVEMARVAKDNALPIKEPFVRVVVRSFVLPGDLVESLRKPAAEPQPLARLFDPNGQIEVGGVSTVLTESQVTVILAELSKHPTVQVRETSGTVAPDRWEDFRLLEQARDSSEANHLRSGLQVRIGARISLNNVVDLTLAPSLCEYQTIAEQADPVLRLLSRDVQTSVSLLVGQSVVLTVIPIDPSGFQRPLPPGSVQVVMVTPRPTLPEIPPR